MPAPAVRNSAAPGTTSSRSRSGTSPQPVRPPLHVGAVDQIADADGGADAVIGEPLHVIDQVLAGERLLRHRPFGNVLESEVAVQVDHRRHHGLAGEIDARGAGRNRHFAAAADRVNWLFSTTNAEFSIERCRRR